MLVILVEAKTIMRSTINNLVQWLNANQKHAFKMEQMESYHSFRVTLSLYAINN